MGGAERRGKLSKDLPSRFCKRAPPSPVGRSQLLKWGRGRGQRPAEQSSEHSPATWQAAHSGVTIALPPSVPTLPRAQGAGTGSGYEVVQRCNSTKEHTGTKDEVSRMGRGCKLSLD